MSFLRNLFSGGSEPSRETAAPTTESSPANSDLLAQAATAGAGALLGPVAPLLPQLIGSTAGSSTGSGPSFPGGGSSMSAPDANATEEEVQQYISLVVRGKNSADHHPGAMAQHADVILSNGAPAGFFGEGGGFFGGIGMGMDGVVADEDWFAANRPGYIDGDIAEQQNMTSTVLQIPVTPEQAAAFDQYWADLAEDPGTFNILGGNCATHAAEAFAAAGLINGGIDGLDTPDNLYGMLAERYPDAESMSGFLDQQHNADGTWTNTVTPNGAPVAYDDTWADGSGARSGLSSAEQTVPSSGNTSRAVQ